MLQIDAFLQVDLDKELAGTKSERKRDREGQTNSNNKQTHRLT
jgi:hypothetical protein